MRAGPRLLVVLQLAAAGAACGAVLLGAGLPLLARGLLGPRSFTALVLVGLAVLIALGAALLERAVVRPAERLLSAAGRLGSDGSSPELPLLGEPGAHGFARAALAFERVVGALGEERRRLAEKVRELTAANRSLGEARASLLRSERLATVGRLAAGVAHEVGNPLGAVLGYADLARAALRRAGDAPTLELVERIDEAARRIDGTVRGLLEFARPAPFSPRAVGLPAAVEGALRLARVQRRFAEVRVELDFPPRLPAVWADEQQLAQVVLNLLLNAGDATAGRGRVRLAARPLEEGRVELAVEDDGPGIAADDLARVFDPFFTTKAPGEGTGLGLAVCHSALEAMGGEISAGNGEGGGARFRVVLRAAPEAT